MLLPLVICLNGLGLAMIYRLDLGRSSSTRAAQAFANSQLVWTVIGIAAFAGVLFAVRDHRRLQTLTYTFGFAAIALLILPLLPVIGRTINGARIWINLGPFSFQPGEAAKICLAIFFAGYLVVKRDALALAGRRFVGIDLPARPRPRPDPRRLAGQRRHPGVPARPRLVAAVLRPVRGDALRRHRASRLAASSAACCSPAAPGSATSRSAHVQVRFDAWLDPFADPDRNGQIINGLFGLAHGGILGTRLGPGQPAADAVLVLRLHRRVAWARSSG